jgi:hypothetical protein
MRITEVPPRTLASLRAVVRSCQSGCPFDVLPSATLPARRHELGSCWRRGDVCASVGGAAVRGQRRVQHSHAR